MDLDKYIAVRPDYPVKGVMFRDITSLIQDGQAYKYTIDELTKYAKELNADVIVGPESRGFIFGCPVATNLNIGFVPVRKPGKLPREVISQEYSLEYGTGVLEMHADSIKPGQRVVIVDDLLATGGTIFAANKMIEKLGGKVVGCGFVIELDGLGGRDKLKDYDIKSLITYQE